MTMPGLLGPAFRERLAAAMRLPVVEALSTHPWTAAARRVLPSPSPQMTATAMWAPIIAWCALETLAESIDAEHPERAALDLFDQLRLRKPLAESFAALGFEGESGWRAAARLKVVLLAQQKAPAQNAQHQPAEEKHELPQSTTASDEKLGSRAELTSTHEPVPGHKPAPTRSDVLAPLVAGIPRELWSDPDVRWLMGVHDAGEYSYLVQEPFEELLWWLEMPTLLALAGQPSPNKADVQAISTRIRESISEAERAGYKLQALLGSELYAESTEEHMADESSVEPEASTSSGKDSSPSISDEVQEQPAK